MDKDAYTIKEIEIAFRNFVNRNKIVYSETIIYPFADLTNPRRQKSDTVSVDDFVKDFVKYLGSKIV